MSLKEFDDQISTAYLSRLVDHTLAKLDQVIRDREEETPEAQFDYEIPPHSYKFESEHVSAWFKAEEIDTLRKTIQSNTYWKAEARALFQVLMERISSGLAAYWRAMTEFVQHAAGDFGTDGVEDIPQTLSRLAAEALARVEAFLEKVWAPENVRTPSHWQEVIRLFHRIAEASGLSSRDIQGVRQEIMDEQYWKCEVEALKPYRYQKEYQQQRTRRRHPSQPSQPSQPSRRKTQSRSTRALRTRPYGQEPKAPAGMRKQTSTSSVAGARVSKLSTVSKVSGLRRSTRLQEQASKRQERGDRAEGSNV